MIRAIYFISRVSTVHRPFFCCVNNFSSFANKSFTLETDTKCLTMRSERLHSYYLWILRITLTKALTVRESSRDTELFLHELYHVCRKT